MNPSFDLLESPWISCLRPDGTPVELGLREVVLRAHELQELHGESPPVTAALHRLFLAVLHRVFGPGSHAEWAKLWKEGRWSDKELDAYFARWRDRFDLFHPERPFYQTPDDRVKPKSVGTLVQEVASGNNPTLFDHHTQDQGLTLTPSQAARMVVAAQAFGVAGLSGLPQKFTDGPCTRGICFLVQGDSLFETLALNLLRYPDDTVMVHQADDRPAWEMDDPFDPRRSRPRGYLDYLTWQNRRVLFTPPAPDSLLVKEMTIAPGLRLDPDVLDPMKHYHQDEKRGPRALRFREDRAVWRDSAALFQLRQAEYIAPRSFDWLAALVDRGYLDQSQIRRYLALGMAANQARVDFYRAERLPLPLAYLRDQDLVKHLQEALEMAERSARQLWGATRTLASLLLSPASDLEGGRQPAPEDLAGVTQQWAVERHYWSRLETPFMEAVEALPSDPEHTLEQWREVLLRSAREAFDQAADNLAHDPRALKAVVRASGQLAAGLAKALPAGQ
jgi:CRISPR system Cascade subunit CasA